MPPRTLAEWLAWQEAVHPHSIDMGLERVARVARALGVQTLPAAVLTVGGTNGKGSVAAHLEALLAAGGARVGLFTSPHLVRYHERIRVEGREVTDAQLLDAFERIEQARGATTLTFFEYNTLAALLIFRDSAVQAAVLEVGLGGRLDATNLIDADVAVLVSVGIDHQEWLGDSLESIGAEKAGIFRSGRPAVLGSAQMPASVSGAIARLGVLAVTAERDFSWRIREAGGAWDYRGLAHSFEGLPPPALAGSIQYRNAATALAAVEALRAYGGAALRPPLDGALVARALAAVRLAGRFQVVPGPVEWILDIAHNEPAAHVLAAQLQARPLPAGARTYGVLGVLADKDAAAIAAALAPVVDHFIACALPGPRGGSAEQLVARLGLPAARIDRARSVLAGCELARQRAVPGDRVLVCGSLHTVGPALEWLRIY
ncbi:MAG: bifunctional tetrahydrofolate synthase/dihydrofolate synthase [Gammaproteobacteria bacterium]|nr:bifunctional tetrahydrofolate synthase/dihydrofolate synthase [Gammaproteobacteria bacterium]